MMTTVRNVSALRTRLLMGACMALITVTGMAAEQAATLKAIPLALESQLEKGRVAIKDEQIALTALKGTDLFTDAIGGSRADNAPRIWFAPQGDFILSTKVASDLGGAYDGAGLIVYGGANDWAKFMFERFQSRLLGVSTTVSDGRGDDAYHKTYDSNELYLKVARRGELYVLYVSRDGIEWDYTRSFSLNGTAVRVGFFAQSPFSESLTATFSDVRFRSETFKNFWQGEP
jgi:regulation of enolase protein 1 (concanavalin A-like superfamily)